jgi:hypothetical protein
MQAEAKQAAFSGQPLAEYHMSGSAPHTHPLLRVLRVLIGVAVLCGAVVITYVTVISRTPLSDAWVLYVASTALFIASMLIIGVRFTPLADSMQISVYSDGIKGRTGRPFQAQWHEIAYLWGEIAAEELLDISSRGQSSMIKTTTKCTIQLIDKRTITFSGERIEKGTQNRHVRNKAVHTIELIEAKFNEVMLPTFIERFERGETIKFPPDFSIDKEGINYRNMQFLEWPEFAYANADLERGLFLIRQTDRRRQSVQDWLTVPTHSIANVTLFQAMLKRKMQPLSGYDWS